MKLLIHLMLLSPILIQATPGVKLPEPVDKPVTFTVMDESGNPIPGAVIQLSRPEAGDFTGCADEEGRLLTHLSTHVSLTVVISKEGYYTSSGRIWDSGIIKGPGGQLVQKVLPDAFEVTLKEILDPKDLIYRMYRGNAPKSDEAVGFDLKKGDWMPPYGTGSYPDLLFRFHDSVVEQDNFSGTMTLAFAKVGDGIQSFEAVSPISYWYRSDLAPPQQAPVNAYDSRITYTLSHRRGEPWNDYRKKDRNYIFRTRTIMDAKGKIRQACYGWILGEIEFDPRDPKGPQLVFTYFFNPDPDPDQRSLESMNYLPAKR